jgi:hypothetical protein
LIRPLLLTAAALAATLAPAAIAHADTAGASDVNVIARPPAGGYCWGSFTFNGTTYSGYTSDWHVVYSPDRSPATSVCVWEDTGLHPRTAVRLPESPTSCPALLTPDGRITSWCIAPNPTMDADPRT